MLESDLKVHTNDEAISAVGAAVFECQPRSEAAKKIARGESLWLIDCGAAVAAVAFPALIGFLCWQLNLSTPIWSDPMFLGPSLLFWCVIGFFIRHIHKPRRLSLHKSGICFNQDAIPFSEISRIEPALPSRARKNLSGLAMITGRGLRRITQLWQTLEFDRAFDIQRKDDAAIRACFVGSTFESGDIDEFFEILRKKKPEFFASRELLDTFAQLETPEPPSFHWPQNRDDDES